MSEMVGRGVPTGVGWDARTEVGKGALAGVGWDALAGVGKGGQHQNPRRVSLRLGGQT